MIAVWEKSCLPDPIKGKIENRKVADDICAGACGHNGLWEDIFQGREGSKAGFALASQTEFNEGPPFPF